MSLQRIILLTLACLSTPLVAAKPVAIVNGQPIAEEELQNELERQPRNRTEALDHLILSHLAVQEALNKGIDRLPDVKRETDKILYRAFLDRSISEAGRALYPSDAEVESFYKNKAPLIRVRILSFYAKTPEEWKKAREKADTVLHMAYKGSDFNVLVYVYSKDGSKLLHQDATYHGLGDLPDPIYLSTFKLKKGQYASVETESGVHLVELMGRKKFSSAPAAYIEFLRGKLRAERENTFVTQLLEKLKKKATITVSAKKDVP